MKDATQLQNIKKKSPKSTFRSQSENKVRKNMFAPGNIDKNINYNSEKQIKLKKSSNKSLVVLSEDYTPKSEQVLFEKKKVVKSEFPKFENNPRSPNSWVEDNNSVAHSGSSYKSLSVNQNHQSKLGI